MKNFVQDGKYLNLTAPSGGVVTGVPCQIGQIVVVPATTAAEGEAFVGAVTGIYDLPKVGSQAWTVGAVVYFDKENTRFTTTATGSLLAGCAVAAVGSGAGETTGRVRLNGAARPDEA